MRFVNVLSLLLLTLTNYAQTLRGRVVDQMTGAPMAFVNLSVAGTRSGTNTDIDGRFTLTPKQPSGTLVASFVGYAAKQVPFGPTTNNLRIELTPTTANLTEVTVRPGPNPAHTIMERVLARRVANNPQNLPYFRYNAYTKFYATLANGFALRSDYTDEDTTTTYFDTTARQPMRSHLFMSESYSERLYKAPGRSQETVLANRVSGLKNPLFAVLGTQFQPFGFYANTLRVLDKDYLNPVNPGYARSYDLELVDTLFRETDSLYVIRFQPQTKRNFEGLAGVMQVSTDGYALDNIVAQSLDETQPLAFRVQQQYRNVSGHWFPVQLHTDLYYQGDRFGGYDKQTGKRVAVHFLLPIRTYLSNIDVRTPLANNQFSYQTTRLLPTMNQANAARWDSLRTAPLTIREARTYMIYDSLGNTRAGRVFNGLSRVVEALLLGRVPVGKVDLLTNRFLRFNTYESVRVGAGAQTNRQWLSWLQLDGYVGYGFRDQSLKYGAGLQLNLSDRLGMTLRGSYQQDIVEPGQSELLTGQNAFSSQQIRAYFMTRADSLRRARVDLSIRPVRNLLVTLAGQTERRNPTYAYRFTPPADQPAPRPDSTFQTTELSLGFRWAWREKLTRIKDQDILTEPSWPVLAMHLTQGLRGVAGGQFEYTKLEARFDHSIALRRLGRATFQLIGGQIWANALPYPYLFAGRGVQNRSDGSWVNRVVYVPGYFQTVGLYEFTNDRYVNLFYQHNLGRLLFRTNSKRVRPEFALLGNAGWGTLANPAYHQNVSTQSMARGLFEAGLLVKRLVIFNLGSNQYNIGAALTRRLGAYQSARVADNWAFNVTFFDLF